MLIEGAAQSLTLHDLNHAEQSDKRVESVIFTSWKAVLHRLSKPVLNTDVILFHPTNECNGELLPVLKFPFAAAERL
jgi:hypothetical protein